MFSTAGKREEKWGGEHHFREGQAKQRLDDLFFDYFDVVEKLRPKVSITENVEGVLLGNAKGYVKEVIEQYDRLSGAAVPAQFCHDRHATEAEASLFRCAMI